MKTHDGWNLHCLAKEAKERLQRDRYGSCDFCDLHANRYEQLLYERTYAIVREGNVLNPIERLIDKARFEAMSPPQRQKYVLVLSKYYCNICKNITENDRRSTCRREVSANG